MREWQVQRRERTRQLIDAIPATEEDWTTEYLDKFLSIKIVDGLEEAIAHINEYGSHHSDAIVTEGYAAAERFLHQPAPVEGAYS